MVQQMEITLEVNDSTKELSLIYTRSVKLFSLCCSERALRISKSTMMKTGSVVCVNMSNYFSDDIKKHYVTLLSNLKILQNIVRVILGRVKISSHIPCFSARVTQLSKTLYIFFLKFSSLVYVLNSLDNKSLIRQFEVEYDWIFLLVNLTRKNIQPYSKSNCLIRYIYCSEGIRLSSMQRKEIMLKRFHIVHDIMWHYFTVMTIRIGCPDRKSRKKHGFNDQNLPRLFGSVSQ